MWCIKVGIILAMGSTNKIRCYIVTSSLIDKAITQNDPWIYKRAYKTVRQNTFRWQTKAWDTI